MVTGRTDFPEEFTIQVFKHSVRANANREGMDASQKLLSLGNRDQHVAKCAVHLRVIKGQQIVIGHRRSIADAAPRSRHCGQKDVKMRPTNSRGM